MANAYGYGVDLTLGGYRYNQSTLASNIFTDIVASDRFIKEVSETYNSSGIYRDTLTPSLVLNTVGWSDDASEKDQYSYTDFLTGYYSIDDYITTVEEDGEQGTWVICVKGDNTRFDAQMNEPYGMDPWCAYGMKFIFGPPPNSDHQVLQIKVDRASSGQELYLIQIDTAGSITFMEDVVINGETYTTPIYREQFAPISFRDEVKIVLRPLYNNTFIMAASFLAESQLIRTYRTSPIPEHSYLEFEFMNGGRNAFKTMQGVIPFSATITSKYRMHPTDYAYFTPQIQARAAAPIGASIASRVHTTTNAEGWPISNFEILMSSSGGMSPVLFETWLDFEPVNEYQGVTELELGESDIENLTITKEFGNPSINMSISLHDVGDHPIDNLVGTTPHVPIELKYDEDTVFKGFVSSVSKKINEGDVFTYTLTCDDKWKILRKCDIATEKQYAGYTVREAILDLLDYAGIPVSDIDIDSSILTYTLPSEDHDSFKYDRGKSIAEIIQELIDDLYAATYQYGFKIDGTFYVREEPTSSSKTFYVYGDDGSPYVRRDTMEETVSDEGFYNEIWVIGRNHMGDPIISMYTDYSSISLPTDEHYIGERRWWAHEYSGIKTKAMCNWVCKKVANKLNQGFKCERTFVSDYVSELMVGDKVTINNDGEETTEKVESIELTIGRDNVYDVDKERPVFATKYSCSRHS